MNKILPFAAPLQSAAAQPAAARDGCPLLDPLPLLHEEPEIPTRLHADAAVWSPALLKQLLAAEAPATRQQTVRTLTRSLGFDSLVYGRFARQGDRWLPQAFCTTYADLGWLQRYVCASYHRVDARLACALRSSLPCIWSIDTLRQPEESTAASSLTQAFLDDLGTTGARSGALLGLPGSHTSGAERHVLSLSSRNEGSAWLNDALLGQVLTLGFCLNDLYTHHLPSPDPAPTSVTPMNRTQQAILQYLACGLCDKQIAWRLALSLHTVDYHMRQLRKRFGARNRVQLIQAAAAPAAAPTRAISGPITVPIN
jgi:DNA-binding CsgD family transcriptional regulator